MDTNVDLAVDEDKRDKLRESSPPKSVDALLSHKQCLPNDDLKEDCEEGGHPEPKDGANLLSSLSQFHEASDDASTPCESDLGSAATGETNPGFSNGKGTVMDDKEGGYNKLKKDSAGHGQAHEVSADDVNLLSARCEIDVDCEEGGHPEPKDGANLLSSLSQFHEVSADATKLPSTPCESDLGSAATGETNPGFSNAKGTVMDDEEGGYNKLKKDNAEHGQEGYIVGSLAADGSKLLSMDLCIDSDCYHCFTVQEIKHVLKIKEPTTLCVPGVETLHKSSEVYELITKKLKTSKGWRCKKTRIMLSLGEIDKELDILKDNLLPNVTPRKGKTQSRGNTSCTSRVIKKAKHISKLARALKRKKKVTGKLIGSELYRMINHDLPMYLKDHIPELIQMVESVQDKPQSLKDRNNWHWQTEALSHCSSCNRCVKFLQCEICECSYCRCCMQIELIRTNNLRF